MAIARHEKCPSCGADIDLRFEGQQEARQLVAYDLNGRVHQCDGEQYPKHPIGQAVTGRQIKDFQLRGRRLTLVLDDGSELGVSAAGKPLSIQLKSGNGVIQE